MKKLTKSDILSIKPGKIEVFVFETAKAIMSARQYAWLIGKTERPQDIGYRGCCCRVVNFKS